MQVHVGKSPSLRERVSGEVIVQPVSAATMGFAVPVVVIVRVTVSFALLASLASCTPSGAVTPI